MLMPLVANDGAGAPIEVTVSGLRSAAGQVIVQVCPQATFLKACPWIAKVPAQRGTVSVVLPGIPPGHYAVQAWHDANHDGDLNTGIFGIPREGLGFSNDAMPRLMHPKFAVAAFDHGAEPQRVAVKIRYFLG